MGDVRALVVLLSIAGGPITALPAQQVEVALADRAPRFLVASPSGGAPMVVDTRSVPALWRRISLDLNDVTLERALSELSRQAGLKLMYSKAVAPLDRRVSLQASNITVAGALIEVLLDAGVDVLLARDGQLVLVRSVQGGTVAGRVTDAKTGQGVAGARVTLQGTGLGALTNDSGGFRVANVPPGSYAVTVRRIGYAQGVGTVAVVEDEEAVLHVRLELSASPLDVVVVTGTLVPTEVKALPTPVSVIRVIVGSCGLRA